MPTPTLTLPPTPPSLVHIQAGDRSWISPLDLTLTLPPPAIQAAPERSSCPTTNRADSNAPLDLDSLSSRAPQHSMSSSTKKRNAAHQCQPFTLPSPPTRSRKIIQMKPPRPPPEPPSPNKRKKTTAATPISSMPNHTSATTSTTSGNSKPTKKAIRKTAHSLIERRRRSKMNDAFATLRDMIPACRGTVEEGATGGTSSTTNGREMHKLDVLHAGIEYLGYLEQCLEQLNERTWEAQDMGPDHGCRCPHQQQKQDDSSPTATGPQLLPSPPPSLEPKPQEHHSPTQYPSLHALHAPPPYPTIYNYSHSIHLDHEAEAEAEAEAEEAATSTAAALLMLTTDRRDRDRDRDRSRTNSTVQVPPSSTLPSPQLPRSAIATRGWTGTDNSGPIHGASSTPVPMDRRSPAKAGLSVRDLLASTTEYGI